MFSWISAVRDNSSGELRSLARLRYRIAVRACAEPLFQQGGVMMCIGIKTQHATCILAQGKGALRSAPEPK